MTTKTYEYKITSDPPRSIIVEGEGSLEALAKFMDATILDVLDGQVVDIPFTSDNAVKLRHYLKGREVSIDLKTKTILKFLADNPEKAKNPDLMWSVELVDLLGYKAPGRFHKIKTGWDLIHYMPLRYLDKTNPQSVEDLELGAWSVVAGVIAVEPEWNVQKDFVKIIVQDIKGRRISAVFFRQKWLRLQYKRDDEVIIYGNYSEYVNKAGQKFPQLTNPKIDKLGSLRGQLDMIPIYPQKQADKSWQLQMAQQELLDKIVYIEDPVPLALLKQFNMISRNDAYRLVHFPNSKEDVEKSRERIAFDEFVRLQVFLEERREGITKKKGTTKTLTNWAKQFENALPFTFTAGQKTALQEISNDMSAETPMYRLLQGDVGTGKALPLYAKILTPQGFVTMRDVKQGMNVSTPDGGVEKIVGVYPQGERLIYQLTFSDGTRAFGDAEHIWRVRRGTRELNLTTQQIIEDRKDGIPFPRVDYAVIGEFGSKWPGNLTPYRVGNILSEPSNQVDASILEELQNFGITELGYQHWHIPQVLLETDFDSRWQLLVGVLDKLAKFKATVREQKFYVPKLNEQFSSDLAYLIRSVGGAAIIKQQGTHYTLVGWTHGLEAPFTDVNKLKIWEDLTPVQRTKGKKIIDITLVDKTEAQCIKITGSQGLFITDDFTVTHNTEISTYATLIAAESGYQVGILAPTDILATQLHQRIINTLDNSSLGHLKIALLTGKLTVKQQREINEQLKSGEINVVVGTHAVISNAVEFNNLGLVIIDEQHKFGSEQRNLLLQKAGEQPQPDFLQMSATPIPRTVSQVVYGDMDITVVPQEIQGRLPVRTVWFEEPTEAYDKVREEVEAGRQAYVVTALVEESEKLEDVESATETYLHLANKVFPDLRVELLHGRMKAEEKDMVMESYKKGNVDILVSTSVIEVGVNVPNATVMVVLNANRFGLASLHQIRGRVGRGSVQSYCYLIGEATTPEAEERLLALCESNDGFWLAEKDLEIRGEGSLFATHQAGTNDLFLATLKEHKHMLEPTKLVARQAQKSVALQKEVKLLYTGKEIKA